jgi:hypothetical protein
MRLLTVSLEGFMATAGLWLGIGTRRQSRRIHRLHGAALTCDKYERKARVRVGGEPGCAESALCVRAYMSWVVLQQAAGGGMRRPATISHTSLFGTTIEDQQDTSPSPESYLGTDTAGGAYVSISQRRRTVRLLPRRFFQHIVTIMDNASASWKWHRAQTDTFGVHAHLHPIPCW